MRTTIDLPDEVFRQAKARAALDGLKLKELITRYVEEGLREGERGLAAPRRRRSQLPIARPATGRPIRALSNTDLYQLLEEEEAAGG